VLIEMQTWFFVLMAVGKKPGNQMNDKIGGTAMTRMLCDPFFLNCENTEDERQGHWP